MLDTLLRPVRAALTALTDASPSPPPRGHPTRTCRVIVGTVMVAVVAVSTAAFWPQELAAQECGHCHDLGLSDNEFRHWSHGVVTPMSGWGPG